MNIALLYNGEPSFDGFPAFRFRIEDKYFCRLTALNLIYDKHTQSLSANYKFLFSLTKASHQLVIGFGLKDKLYTIVLSKMPLISMEVSDVGNNEQVELE